MEVASPFFRTPQPHHLAELRIEAAQSAVSFSAPCAAGRKRRCLLPAFSPRKKMLLELAPFSAPASAPSPAASTGYTANVFSSALAPTGGNGGSSSGSFAFFALPEQPLTPAGSNGSGAFAFLASPERPLTPMGSTSSGGCGVLAPQPSLSPGTRGSSGTGAFEFLASPKPARTGSNGGGGGFALFASPGPQHTGTTGIGAFPFSASPKTPVGRTGSPVSAATKELAPTVSAVSGGGGLVSPPFVFSASRTSASPVRKSRGGTLWSRRRRSQRQSDEQLRITLPPRKVAKTEALATGEPPRRATQSVSTGRPCCTFLTSPAKASKQEAKKDILAASDASRSSSPYRSPAGTCCTFVTSPTRPSSVEKASKREREVQVSSVAGEGPTSPAACRGAEVVVRVTCSCGARKEFCFDHCH